MNVLRLFKIRILIFLGKAIDINSKGKWPSNELSNFFPHDFVLDGVKCASMEGFLQSLKVSDVERQKFICSLSGKEAKSHSTVNWKENQILYWNGKTYHRAGSDFQELLKYAFEEMSKQNSSFRKALIETKKRNCIIRLGIRS